MHEDLRTTQVSMDGATRPKIYCLVRRSLHHFVVGLLFDALADMNVIHAVQCRDVLADTE